MNVYNIVLRPPTTEPGKFNPPTLALEVRAHSLTIDADNRGVHLETPALEGVAEIKFANHEIARIENLGRRV